MKWPRTLFARVMLILLAGLAAAQVLAFAFALLERGIGTRKMMVGYAGVDLASSIAMLDRLPAGERSAWLPRLQRPNYRLWLAEHAAPALEDSDQDGTGWARPLVQALTQALGPGQSAQVVRTAAPESMPAIQLLLRDGTPIQVALMPPRFTVSPWAVAVLAAQWALLAALCWWATRLVTLPLSRLAEASDAFNSPQPAPPLAEDGPLEVARASAAFNRMQGRIAAHLAERMHMLAAISHDLRTPITRMRLRTEWLADESMRDKLNADLGQMQHLVEQGLAYARSAHAVQEAAVRTDLAALLQSVVADYADAAQPVAWCGGPACILATRPQALRRIVQNLIDNALKYAGTAEVELERVDGAAVLRVLDRGTGIAPEVLQRVMQPFERLEDLHHRGAGDSGGAGLGLAIAQRLATACDAELTLTARTGGGLVASLRLAA